MAFGVKIKKVKVNGKYTIEGFYEAMKDGSFTAGQPSLTKHGLVTIITFPAIDRQNQVQIVAVGFGKETSTFQVQKGEEAGVGNAVANAALDKLSGGLFGFGSIAGKNVKKCEQLVVTTAEELEKIGL